jgi:hypothetical protein
MSRSFVDSEAEGRRPAGSGYFADTSVRIASPGPNGTCRSRAGIRTRVAANSVIADHPGFRRRGVAAELGAAGLSMTHWWSDPAGDFGLSLAIRP